MLRELIVSKVKELNKADIQHFIRNDINPFDYYIDEYMKGLNKFIVISFLKKNWHLVEDLVTNMDELYEDILKEKPEWKKTLLNTPKGKLWFKKVIWNTYNNLYDLVWGKNGK